MTKCPELREKAGLSFSKPYPTTEGGNGRPVTGGKLGWMWEPQRKGLILHRGECGAEGGSLTKPSTQGQQFEDSEITVSLPAERQMISI